MQENTSLKAPFASSILKVEISFYLQPQDLWPRFLQGKLFSAPCCYLPVLSINFQNNKMILGIYQDRSTTFTGMKQQCLWNNDVEILKKTFLRNLMKQFQCEHLFSILALVTVTFSHSEKHTLLMLVCLFFLDEY